MRLRDVLSAGKTVMQVEGPAADPYEVPLRIAKAGTTPILFKNAFGGGEQIVANIFASKDSVSGCLGIDDREFLRDLGRRITNPIGSLRRTQMDAFQEKKVGRGTGLPAFQYFRSDAGKYVTSSVFLAQDPDSQVVNMSVHRMLVLNDKSFAVRMVEGRHLHRIFTRHRERGQDTPVAILVGCMPEVMVAACCPVKWGESEMRLAGSLAGGELPVVEPPGLDFSVPSGTEYLLVGSISKSELAPESQVDILGTPDAERRQPVVRISGFYAKESPLYHAILPSGYEHKTLMGIPRAAAVWTALEGRGIEVSGLALTPGSGGWLHCVISIKKKTRTDARDAVLVALNAHGSVKGVVVVDEDINPEDYESIDFALATRLRERDQLITYEGLRGSSLDPSADRESHATLKWGLDLTLDTNEDKRRFMKEPIA